MLGIALLLAGASVFLTQNWVQNQVQPVAAIEDQKKLETTEVIVASTQLHFGNKVRREHLRVVDWPTAAVPEGSFKSIEDILGKEEVDEKTGVKKKAEDRTALRTIEVNEPILKSKITGFGGRASLSTLIAPGMRATTIRVNDVSGVAGFVLPGDRVDILLTRDPDSGKRRGNNLQTDVFLQNMKVLAIAQDANQDRNKAAVVKAVTLEVTPTQAQKLTLAQKLGSLSLALRHINTVNAEAPQSIKARDLNVGEANLAPKPKAPDSGTTTATVADPVTFEAATPEPTESAKAPTVVTKTVTKSTKKKLKTIKIVRGLKSKEYEVTPEKATFSAPAYSKPLNLLPSALAPAGGVVAPAAPAVLSPSPLAPAMPAMLAPTMNAPGAAPTADEGGKTALGGTPGALSTSEPISLLNSGGGGRTGDDG
jgi:pilus assembly protein CpaB